MSQFIEPGVKFERIPNPKYAILPGGTAEVVFIGMGALTLPQDSVAMVKGASNTAGTSISGMLLGTEATTSGAKTLGINLNSDGVKQVTLIVGLNTGSSIASSIQAAVRATQPTDANLSLAYSAFTATWDNTAKKYTLTSGLPGLGSAVIVTDGTTNDVAALLKLGAANSYTSETAGAEMPDVLPTVPTGTVTLKYGSATFTDLGPNPDYAIAGDELSWTVLHGPSYGATYYATYAIDKVAADFAFTTKYSHDEVLDAYGSDTDSANTISVASKLFFANGGVRLNIVQIEPAVNPVADFTAALNSLELEDIDIIVPLLKQDATYPTLFSLCKEHVYRMSQPDEGKNRMVYLAPETTTTLAQYIALAPTLALDRCVLTAPATSIVDFNGTATTLPAFYYNAAMSGFLANPDTIISEPLTRKELFGIKQVGSKFTKSQLRSLLTAGVLTIENAAGIIRVVHGITTDRTLVDTSEISLVRISDFFGKTLKNVLDKSFIGSRIDVTTLSSIRGTIGMVIDNFIANGALIGAKQISVTQDTLNPTLVYVSMIVQPVYPLNFIDIKFTLEL